MGAINICSDSCVSHEAEFDLFLHFFSCKKLIQGEILQKVTWIRLMFFLPSEGKF